MSTWNRPKNISLTLSICQVTSSNKTPELVAAVSDAGGPGVLAASHLIQLRQGLFQKNVKDHSSQMIYAC
jgi:acyl-CoA synthetase (NDP forming)